jgi:hypothetical protein
MIDARLDEGHAGRIEVHNPQWWHERLFQVRETHLEEVSHVEQAVLKAILDLCTGRRYADFPSSAVASALPQYPADKVQNTIDRLIRDDFIRVSPTGRTYKLTSPFYASELQALPELYAHATGEQHP